MQTFEVLALDQSNQARCDTSSSLLYMIRGYSRMWSATAIVKDEKCRIVDGGTTLEVREKGDLAKREDSPTVSRAFLVTLNGEYKAIGPLRELLVEYMKDLKFSHRYVIRDEVSEFIACELYPLLYRIENLLRGYLSEFLTTHIGAAWWELTASAEMSSKARMRKKNEKAFGDYIDNSAYLIDFNELGELVYQQSSGFLTREDIVNRVSGLRDNDAESLKTLKHCCPVKSRTESIGWHC